MAKDQLWVLTKGQEGTVDVLLSEVLPVAGSSSATPLKD